MSMYLFLFIIVVGLALLLYLENRQTQPDKKEEQTAERKAKEEADRIAAREEAERKAKEEADRIAAREEAEEKEKTSLQRLPEYPSFDHARLLEMGLSDTEAKEFVHELIPQIETQLPLIEKALQADNPDFEAIEQLTHSIKGSSTNIGTGGIADLLTDYNTYLKSGNSTAQAKVYLKALYQELEKLKVQYL